MITISPSGGDDTATIIAAIAADSHVEMLAGTFSISDEIDLPSGQKISTPGATIVQTVPDKGAFKATSKTDIVLDLLGGTLIGEGSWSSLWTGSNGHNDQAIRLVGCQDIKVLHPTIKNCAHAGISIYGGQGIYIESPVIEGTHLFGSPLPAQANYQNGIFIQDVLATGATSVTIVHPDISNTAQGVLVETYSGVDCLHRSIQIISPFVHDIPGQHAFYIQSGNVTITDPVMHDVELAGVKFQSSAYNNQHIRNLIVSGAVGVRVKSNLLELASLGSGSISNVRMEAVGDTIGTGLAVVGNVNDMKADLTLAEVAATAVLVQGSGADDLDITAFARGIGQHGAIISAQNAYNIRLRPTFRNPAAGPLINQNGVVVATNNQCVDLINPELTDSAGKMRYGIYSSVAATRIRGYSSILGYTVGATYGPII